MIGKDKVIKRLRADLEDTGTEMFVPWLILFHRALRVQHCRQETRKFLCMTLWMAHKAKGPERLVQWYDFGIGEPFQGTKGSLHDFRTHKHNKQEQGSLSVTN